jgi:peptide/nickel transport system substrate-binding protein
VNHCGRPMRALRVIAALALTAAAVGACGSSGAQTGGTTSSHSTAVKVKQTGPGLTEPTTGSGSRVSGKTASFAEAPEAPPNQIFPMYSAEYCDPNNIGQLSDLLYRPLYWYGNNYSPTVDYNYSVGKKPIFSNGGKTITINLNHYMWSDGEQVSARDLVFWLNVLNANPTKNWCNSAPGRFPYNITSYKAVNPTTFQMTLNKAYNQTWIIYNELSQLTPMPIAWDRTSLSQKAPSADAPNLPDTTKSGAEAVYDFLNNEGTKIASWGDSPIWSVVDGPWTVQSTTSNGGVTFVPNKDYSGSPKPTLAKFVEVPYTAESAMIDQIKSQGTAALSVGYIPSQYQPLTGSFKSLGYDVNMGSTYTTDFIPLNNNAPKIGVVFRQLYARQALQHLVDQNGWIEHFLHGTAVPTYGPVPFAPPSPLLSSGAESDVYPFSVTDAQKLLKANGWKVAPGGQSTCERPGTGAGECGKGISKDQPFTFNIDYESGVTAVQEEMQDLQSQASKVGIKITLTSHPYDDVAGSAQQCDVGAPKCDWDAENYGAGWLYGPGYYPTGEVLYYSTSYVNFANYKNAKMDQLVNATLYAKPSQERAAMDTYVNYTERQIPYLWMPEQVGAYGAGNAGTLVDSKLGGFTVNAFGTLTPETWYFTK